MTYDVLDENYDASIYYMSDTAIIQYQNGELASDIASLDMNRYTINIQTDDEDKIGV